MGANAAWSAPGSASQAPLPGPAVRTMRVVDLDEVTTIENRAYPFPWSRGNFVDSLAAGYLARVLVAPGDGDQAARRRVAPEGPLLGYYLAMPGVEEMHLLNITVAPEHEHRGHARSMLRHLMAESRQAGARSLWLEVRESNQRARALYERWGFQAVGQRKGYYPAAHGQREHAIVMSLALTLEGDASALE